MSATDTTVGVIKPERLEANNVETGNAGVLAKPKPWKQYQKIAFRIAFLYFLFLCIPTYSAFYERLFSLKFSKITYNDFQEIVAFWPPQIITIESEEGVFGLYNYINLILVFAGAVIGGGIWTLLDRKSTQYNKLYYWIRVLARY